MEQSIEVPAEWASIARLAAFNDEIETYLPLSDEQSYLLRLATEEIATNIIKYGYHEHERGVIQFACVCVDGQLHITIRDHGQPFDPYTGPDPDLNADVAEREVGGLGLFLVRDMADHLTYHHDAVSGWNELVVVKYGEAAHV